MNRDNIILPRSVVEQALDAFAFAYNACESDWVMDEKIDPAMKLIQAALEQPQVEQEPAIYPEEAFDMGLEAIPYYTHPQNLRCKSTQARLATLWGYEKPQPPRQPLTNERIREIGQTYTDESWIDEGWSYSFARAIEAAHGIGGEE